MSAPPQSPTNLPIRAAMEARDRAAVLDAFAEDAVLRSPFTPSLVFTGHDELAALIDVLLDALDDLGYSDELIGDHTAVLVGTMQLSGVSINFTDHLKLRPDGKISEMTVFFRPLPATAAAMQVIGAGLGHRNSKLRGRTISALVAPLAFMTRAGDRLGSATRQAHALARARIATPPRDSHASDAERVAARTQAGGPPGPPRQRRTGRDTAGPAADGSAHEDVVADLDRVD